MRASAATVVPLCRSTRQWKKPPPIAFPVLALDLALKRLAGLDEDLARVVELRAFGGLTIEETACVLRMSPTTTKREWRTAKAWLTRELGLESRP